MSCPHLSAVAAILKSYRKYWIPAAIMTNRSDVSTNFNTEKSSEKNVYSLT
jgi:hypothetical protein